MLKTFNPYKKIINYENANVSVVFLFNNRHEVLLQHRDNKKDIVHPNIWGPPGGHCSLDETPYECAIREMKEETNYLCKELYWENNYIFPYYNNQKHLVSVFWSIYDDIQTIKCFEGQKMEFITLSNLDNYDMLNKNLLIIKKIYDICKLKGFFSNKISKNKKIRIKA